MAAFPNKFWDDNKDTTLITHKMGIVLVSPLKRRKKENCHYGKP